MDEQSRVIDFLSRPESYGGIGPVERIDTHAAIVFLAGTRAYKLMRAVHYPYLDFSTAARRRLACEAELRLNRRTAPDLYHEVRSVNRIAGDQLGFGPGEPVDWLVVMQRFDQECLLEQVAARGALSSPLVLALAAEIAHFHEVAEPVPVIGAADAMAAVIDGNRIAMEELASGCLPSDAIGDLHDQSRKMLERLAPLLNARGAAGHVRHCHGDLHLANICLWKGRPTLFDCLEFNEGLARIDTLYDLAFLIMDMWRKGCQAQANLLVNRYLDLCEDDGGMAAMPLFLSMRAGVRAHVICAAAQMDENKRAERTADARSYMDQSFVFLRSGPPRLVAIGGLSGTGKSTLAQAIAHRIGHPPGARVLRTDVIRKRLSGVSPETPLPESAYGPDMNRRVYDALLEKVQGCLSAGMSVIADAVFARPDERDAMEAVARKAGCRFDGIWLQAAPKVLVTRVNARSGDASDATGRVVEQQLGYDLGDLSKWRILDSGAVPSDLAGLVMKELGGVQWQAGGNST